LRVEVHEFVEEDVGNGRHAHRGPGMPGIGFAGSIDLRQHNGYVRVGLSRGMVVMKGAWQSLNMMAAMVGFTYRE
jgi:hypothetical protein